MAIEDQRDPQPTNLRDLVERFVAMDRVWDLSQVTHAGMPIHRNQPGYLLSLTRRHGDQVRAGGYSVASEVIVTCAHHGTHIDALGHVSVGGALHGGASATAAQTSSGLTELDASSIKPIIARGVLIDIARHRGVKYAPAGSEVTLEETQEILSREGVQPEPGDVVMFRVGWGARWRDRRRYCRTDGQQPGPGLAVAQWLSRCGVRAVGSDTADFEVVVADQATLPVHAFLLFEAGIFIMENLRLEELSQSGLVSCVFLGFPTALGGGTGAPLRPIAVG